MKALSGFLMLLKQMTDDLESIIMFESFIGHICRTVC